MTQTSSNSLMPGDPIMPATVTQKMFAWSIHLLTATGAIWALLTILAIEQGAWHWAFLWIVLAVIIDAVDGGLARLFQASSVLPDFDGALLDNIVDYLNYVFVPAYLLYTTGLLPESVAFLGALIILLTSGYQFCQSEAKTEDHHFKGFPSYWNILALYVLLLNLNPWLNFVAVVMFGILVFVPILYVYPTRTTQYLRLTMTLTILWGIISAVVLFQYPQPQPWMVWASFLYLIYYAGLSLYNTWQRQYQLFRKSK